MFDCNKILESVDHFWRSGLALALGIDIGTVTSRTVLSIDAPVLRFEKKRMKPEMM